MLCLKKRRTYSFTQGACNELPRRSKRNTLYNEALNIAVTTLPRKHRSREERPSAMVLTVTEDTPADMLAGSMELLVQLPRDHTVQTQRVTVQRSTPMMDLLVQITTAHKLAASSYTLQAIGERGFVLPHQPNTPIGALDALQVKLLPKQGTFLPRKTRQANQPFETTFRLQVHLPRNQLYVSRVSPKMNLGDILEEVCREKNLDIKKYELRHPANLEETLDLSLSLQDYHLQEVTLYAKQGRTLGSALSSQDIMALQKQEERRRQQAKQSVFGFIFKKSKESSLSTDSLGGRSVSPARSDETGRSTSPMPPPPRPFRKRRPAPKPPVSTSKNDESNENSKEKMVISHSRNSSDSSGYHEASVLSDHPDSAGRMLETLPRRGKTLEAPRKLAQTSQASKSLGNLALASGGLSHGVSTTSLSSTGQRKKRAAPAPPIARLPSALSTQGLERIVDSEESLTSDMELSKPSSDIGASSKANSDIGVHCKSSSDIGVSITTKPMKPLSSSETSIKTEETDIRPTLKTSDESEKKIQAPEIVFKEDANVIKPVSKEPFVASANEPVVASAKVVKRDSEPRLSETDILLRKVSDTLSSALPPTPPPTPLESWEASQKNLKIQEKEIKLETKVPEKFQQVDCLLEIKQVVNKNQTLENSTSEANLPDATVNSQQDTSDYVSASGEDLSLPDWEYQLPAPPSAFRDVEASTYGGCDTITLKSVDAFKESGSMDQTDFTARLETTHKPETKVAKAESDVRPEKSQQKKPSRQISLDIYKADVNLELKREIISELESKIETRSHQFNSKEDFDARRASEEAATLNIAPVDNTLSNFTFTTYSRQKSVNIFDELEESVPIVKSSNDRVKTSATLARSQTLSEGVKDIRPQLSRGCPADAPTKGFISRGQSIDRVAPSDLELRSSGHLANLQENLNRRQSLKNDVAKPVAVYRSKSYITLASNDKYKGLIKEEENGRDVVSREEGNEGLVKKATSVTNLIQEMPRSNEKFSQWRDNILKRQEEPTKEKQLQSLQVLKSILPQLKHAQQAEESVRKNTIESQPMPEKKSGNVPEGHSLNSKVVSTSDVQRRSESKTGKANPEKRYTYSGPPAVSLGSWSERPCVNVQIKMDTDYFAKSNSSGLKTVVNLNGSRNESDLNGQEISKTLPKKAVNGSIERDEKPEYKEASDFTKKIVPHTTASGFKKPVLSKVSFGNFSTEVKSIITDSQEVEPKSMNFEELAKSFGQEVVRLRAKPKPLNQNRHSEYFGRKPEIVNNDANGDGKQNGFQESSTVVASNGTQNIPVKKYTSVVGLNSQSNHFRFANGQGRTNNVTSMRINGVMPVVKGFNVQPSQIQSKVTTVTVKQNELMLDSTKKDARIPKPPTMPVITGVTLKSANARPKSMPVNADARDQLLESIRNFGGRHKLRSAAERY
ncbi:protein cordon-bleu isoform X4 [Belonocnema kinseyi]|uniref:protein cordon-bleu isoform X4 n=1 Tax=Belonocnema kinseyi TaxID=2817044 RepID=UPI00143D74F7|nr:protein cordon-bleu isoform X4 [Belonocnema kinseyi]